MNAGGGKFHASAEFDRDPVQTAREIEERGTEAQLWLGEQAASLDPALIDVHLVRTIHRRWFESTFPKDAGRERVVPVFNRKSTAVEVDAIVPGVHNACDNWTYRFAEVVKAASGEDQIELLVQEANTLAVRVYDIHPFIDGNTRTTFSLRNYALMLGGVGPVLGLNDVDEHTRAWMAATPHDHDDLDQLVLEALVSGDL